MDHLSIIDHILTTTRSVRRRLDFDRPVEPEIIETCLEIAIQAPTGSNMQGWRFLVITDAQKRATVAEYYRQAFAAYVNMRSQNPTNYDEDDPRAERADHVAQSAIFLAENMHRVPVLIIPCIEGRVEVAEQVLPQASIYGSILPATWSLMLALRARGLGSSWTTLHLMFEKQVAEILSIPATFTQAALLPVAYFSGDDFKPAKRIPAKDLTYWNGWGQ